MKRSEIDRLRSIAETCERSGLTPTTRELARGTLRLLEEREQAAREVARLTARIARGGTPCAG